MAKGWVFWFMYLAPILMKDCLDDHCFCYMCQLMDIMKTCIQFMLRNDKINALDDHIISWVRDYEKYISCIHDFHCPSQSLMDSLKNILPIQCKMTFNVYSHNPWTLAHLQQYLILCASLGHLNILDGVVLWFSSDCTTIMFLSLG